MRLGTAVLLALLGIASIAWAGHVGTNYGKWANGMMYYEIDSSMNHRIGDINTAISWINDNTNCRVVARTSQSGFVKFYKQNYCNSYLGYINSGEQPINIADGCGVGSITHEIMHAYGIHHEMTRADRDTYVDVRFEDIQDDKEHNFEIPNNHASIGAYDYDSLMHYPKVAFPDVPGTPTVVPIPDENRAIGNRAYMTTTDRSSLNYFCPTPDCPNCQHGTCKFPPTTTATTVCECDPGWSGTNCDQSQCDPECVNGSCNASQECDCDPPNEWRGEACDEAICPNGCDHGTCAGTTTHKCNCDSGWEEDDSTGPGTGPCSVPVCDPPCHATHGECTAPNTCTCHDPSAYAGPTCSDPQVCDPTCNADHGYCDAGSCVCDDFYSGATCDTEENEEAGTVSVGATDQYTYKCPDDKPGALAFSLTLTAGEANLYISTTGPADEDSNEAASEETGNDKLTVKHDANCVVYVGVGNPSDSTNGAATYSLAVEPTDVAPPAKTSPFSPTVKLALYSVAGAVVLGLLLWGGAVAVRNRDPGASSAALGGGYKSEYGAGKSASAGGALAMTRSGAPSSNNYSSNKTAGGAMGRNNASNKPATPAKNYGSSKPAGGAMANYGSSKPAGGAMAKGYASNKPAAPAKNYGSSKPAAPGAMAKGYASSNKPAGGKPKPKPKASPAAATRTLNPAELPPSYTAGLATLAAGPGAGAAAAGKGAKGSGRKGPKSSNRRPGGPGGSKGSRKGKPRSASPTKGSKGSRRKGPGGSKGSRRKQQPS